MEGRIRTEGGHQHEIIHRKAMQESTKIMGLTQEEFDRKKQAILFRVRGNPGIDEDRCAAIAGFAAFTAQSKGRSNKRNSVPQRILKSLVDDGLITLEAAKFAIQAEPRRVYPVKVEGRKVEGAIAA